MEREEGVAPFAAPPILAALRQRTATNLAFVNPRRLVDLNDAYDPLLYIANVTRGRRAELV